MALYSDSNAASVLKGQYVLLDNDFLGTIFADEECFKETMKLLGPSELLVDPLTRFEFLRDIYVPSQRKLREEFINKEIFNPTPNHHEIYQKIQHNALILSLIYAQHRNDHRASPGTVDLYLAGRMMLVNGVYLLITGNTKDFPDVVFDTQSVLTIKQSKEGVLKPFGVLKLSFSKFNQAYKSLKELK